MLGKVAGTLVGGTFALLLGWPPTIVGIFGIIGAVVGHLIVDAEGLTRGPRVDAVFQETRPPRQPFRPRPRPPPQVSPREESLAASLSSLFIEIARIDGPVVQAEIRAIRQYFQGPLRFGEAASEVLRRSLKAALAGSSQALEPMAEKARELLAVSERVWLVKALYEMVDADGEVKRSELDAIRQVVVVLRVSEAEVFAITSALFGDGTAHYQTLGVSTDVSDEDVRTAFRRLAAENHPDRVASLGPAESVLAAERFRKVKEAYEAIRKLRGL